MMSRIARSSVVTLLMLAGFTRTCLAVPVERDLSSAAGVHWQFRPEQSETFKQIMVPAGGWRAQGYSCDAGTYRASIPIPADAKGQTIRIAFAAVNFGAEVKAGPDPEHLNKIASHVNGWVPFTADVTSIATPGNNLTVEVDVQGRKKFMKNGKYTVPEGATWYSGLEEGILRGVKLQILPEVRIEDICVRMRINPDTLQAIITVVNDTEREQTVRLRSALTPWQSATFNYARIPEKAVIVPAKSVREVDLGSTPWIAGTKSYWWPNVPYRPDYKAQLHLLNVALLTQSQVLQYSQRFGFRQFSAVGNHYELNGVRVNLRGDNQQEANFGTDAYGIKPGFGTPTKLNAGWPQAVDNLLHLNFNVMRIHQIPATPYMLDVCDEKGLMLVEESPLRGSEGGEDYQAGKEAMLNMDRELVLRDRNHPSVVIWSAANEWAEPIRDAIQVINSVDAKSRPIIADGIGDIGSDVINMDHYVNGGSLPRDGGRQRADRPFGETESVWPNDNTMQGFATMATGTRLRRLKNDSDIRNYVLNNAFPNYVPGESEATEVLEIKVKGNPSATILPSIADPWHNANIKLMQQCYNPVMACDIDFDKVNARSNRAGEWPIAKPTLSPGTQITRKIAVFNDEFSDSSVVLRWELHKDGPTGTQISNGERRLNVPLGEFVTTDLPFSTPASGEVVLVLSTLKAGSVRFKEDRLTFKIGTPGDSSLKEGDYRILNMNSGLAAEVRGDTRADGTHVVQAVVEAKPAQIWHLKRAGSAWQIVNKASGLALSVLDVPGEAALAIQRKLSEQAALLWEIEDRDGSFVLTNKGTGKVLDVYAQKTTDGAKIVQWEFNSGLNQMWELKRVQ